MGNRNYYVLILSEGPSGFALDQAIEGSKQQINAKLRSDLGAAFFRDAVTEQKIERFWLDNKLGVDSRLYMLVRPIAGVRFTRL